MRGAPLRGEARWEEASMARRPFAFRIRLRDKNRTLRLRAHEREPRRRGVEDTRPGKETRRREHPTLTRALEDLAVVWENRCY
jgi:hypothetical protein